MKVCETRVANLPGSVNDLLFRTSVVSLIFVAPFLVNNFVEGRFTLGIFALLIESIFILNAWTISRHGYHFFNLTYLVLWPLVIGFLLFSVHRQGMIGVLWCYPAILSSYFLLEKRPAYITNALVLAVTIPMIIAKFEPHLAVRIVGTMVLVSLLAAIFVDVISRQRQGLEAKNEGLRVEINERIRVEKKLAAEIARHRETAQDLQWVLNDARQANDAKSRFLSGMTHELRTPLNAIIGFGQMLDGQAGPITEDQKAEYLKYILAGSDRLYGLINQALDLAGIEAGKISFTITEVSPRSVVERVLQELSGLAEKQRVTLHNDLGDDPLPFVSADQARLTQALVNLVGNAVKYNRPNGEVHISCTDTTAYLRFEISDTGLGIPADRQSEVFETFNRLGNETTAIEGSGVGLSLTKEFIEKMDGRIGFESVQGVGSTFWFELPRAEPVNANAPLLSYTG